MSWDKFQLGLTKMGPKNLVVIPLRLLKVKSSLVHRSLAGLGNLAKASGNLQVHCAPWCSYFSLQCKHFTRNGATLYTRICPQAHQGIPFSGMTGACGALFLFYPACLHFLFQSAIAIISYYNLFLMTLFCSSGKSILCDNFSALASQVLGLWAKHVPDRTDSM